MSGTASNLLNLWHTPSTKLFLRISKLHNEKREPLHFCRKLQTATYEIVKGSYVPAPKDKPETSEKKAPVAFETVGAFQRLPMVKPSVDILYSALRKARKISPTKGIANIAKREKNRGARQLDALMKELGVPLREYMESFPNKMYLHPYERSLIELTLGDGNYEEVLRRVNALKKKVVSVGKEQASLCAKSLTKREAEERLNEGKKKLEDIFIQEGKAVDDLLNIAKTLRAVPVVDLETPTLCLVGAPNVGKSSLVRILSTGKPEICNYPFTTRGILMGHITVNYQRFQVTDTPGLLKRCDGNFVEFAIFGAKKRIKTLIIPAGEGGAGLGLFADALAATTAGPDCPRTQSGAQTALCGRNFIDGWSFAAVVTPGASIVQPPDVGEKESIDKTRVSLWGPHSEIMRAVSITVSKRRIRVFLNLGLPERMARVLGMRHAAGEVAITGKRQEEICVGQ